MSKTAPAPEPKAEPKPASLHDTLTAIADAERAEKQAGEDAYQRLVQDLAADLSPLTPAAVVAVLKRAGRSTDDLSQDVSAAKELGRLEAEFARLPERIAATAAATEALGRAQQEYAAKLAEIEQPVAAAAAAVGKAKDAEMAARQAQARAKFVRDEQAKRDAKRLGLVKRWSTAAPVAVYVGEDE